MLRRSMLLILAALLMPTSQIAAVPRSEAEVVHGAVGRRLDEVLERYEAYGLSATVLVAKDGQVVLHKGYGYADHERRVANAPDTLFEMASITKTFTAAAILRLEAQGRLSTADPIGKYLGPFPGPKAAATVEHLLNHKAGLAVAGTDIGGDGTSRDRFVRDMKDTPMESPPGERFRYTNAGYSLLAAVVEEASGRSFESFVREELLRPAGMASTGFRGDFPPGHPRLARGHVGTPVRAEATTTQPYVWGTRGAGGLVATVGDVYTWYLALQGDRVLPAEVRRRVFAPAPSEQYGWHVETSSWGSPFIHKGGGMPDFATQILSYPKEGLVIAWASNDLRQRWRPTLNAAVTDAALGRPVALPPPPVRIDAAELGRYAGSYSTPAGEAVELRAGNGFLYVAAGPPSAPTSVRFVPTSRGGFTAFDAAKISPIALSFERGPDRDVRALVLRAADGELRAQRTRGNGDDRRER